MLQPYDAMLVTAGCKVLVLQSSHTLYHSRDSRLPDPHTQAAAQPDVCSLAENKLCRCFVLLCAENFLRD